MKSAETGMLWTRSEKAARGPQPAFDREQIAQVAMRLADEEGVEAVSMRRVAADLGTMPMSLYRYVLSKEEMLDLMVDAAIGHSRMPKSSGDWRSDLKALAHSLRASARRHPWTLSVPVRATLGPNGLAVWEAFLEAVDGHGLDADAMLLLTTSITTFVRGFVAGEIAEQQSLQRSGMSRNAWMAAQEEYIARLRADGKHRLFLRIVDEAETPHNAKLLAERFDSGLSLLLDGIALRMQEATHEVRR